MRILIISNYYPPDELGGWEQLTCNVAEKLRARGHQVSVLTSNHRADQVGFREPEVNRLLYLESPDYVHYHIQYTLLHGWQERKNKKNLTLMVERFRPDIIFINGMWNLPHSVAKKAEQLLPGRVAYYVASYWPTELDAHTAYWTSTADKSWVRMPKKLLGQLVQKTILTSTPRSRLDFCLVMCVSAFVRDYMVNEAGVSRERTRVVHNGIEIELFKVNASWQESEVLRLLYAGRLSPDKGAHTLIESLAHLRRAYPNVQFLLSVYGSGSPEYEERLKSMVHAHHLESWVCFQGLVPREQMPEVFAAHDVLVFPSIWSEPLARVIQEAMACGLVVIGTVTGGTQEILTDGENGLTFEAENAQMLAKKVAQVAKDKKLRERLALAARRTVEERFTLERMVSEIEASFAELIRQPEYA